MSATATAGRAAASAPRRKDAPRERLRVVEAPARRRRPRQLYGDRRGARGHHDRCGSDDAVDPHDPDDLRALVAGRRAADLTYQKQMLYDDVAGLSSPQYLAANAAALGMVIDESPNYLRLSDGALLGAGEASLGGSSVDAIGRGVVANALITDTPLVTDPDATIEGVPVETRRTPAVEQRRRSRIEHSGAGDRRTPDPQHTLST